MNIKEKKKNIGHGGVDSNTKMKEFSYLNDELNEDFIDAFNRMQDRYITKDEYRLKLEEVLMNLKYVKDILVKYDF